MHELEKWRTGFQTKLKGHTVVKKVDNHWTRVPTSTLYISILKCESKILIDYS